MNPVILKQKLEMCTITNTLVKFDYVGKDLKVSRDRVMLPIKLLNDKAGTPDAIQALDMEKQEMRAFKFEGIQNLRMIRVADFFDTGKNNVE